MPEKDHNALTSVAEEKNLKVEYMATAADYRRVLVWYRWKRIVVLVSLSFVVSFFLLYPVLSGTPGSRPPLVIFSFLFFLPLLVFGILYLGIRRQATEIEKVFEPVKVTFTNEGMESCGETSSGEMSWKDFDRVYETSQDFVFFPTPKIFYTIPKRFFRDGNEISQLKAMLGEKLRNKVYLKN